MFGVQLLVWRQSVLTVVAEVLSVEPSPVGVPGGVGSGSGAIADACGALEAHAGVQYDHFSYTKIIELVKARQFYQLYQYLDKYIDHQIVENRNVLVVVGVVCTVVSVIVGIFYFNQGPTEQPAFRTLGLVLSEDDHDLMPVCTCKGDVEELMMLKTYQDSNIEIVDEVLDQDSNIEIVDEVLDQDSNIEAADGVSTFSASTTANESITTIGSEKLIFSNRSLSIKYEPVIPQAESTTGVTTSQAYSQPFHVDTASSQL